MTLARRQFLQSVGAATAIAAVQPDSSYASMPAPQGEPPRVFGLERPTLHVEIGGLAAFEWWKTDKRMLVHFLSGRGGTHAFPHRLLLTADMRNIHEASVDAETLILLPGAESPVGAWSLDGYELSIGGAPAKGALQVEAQAPELPAPSKPDDPESWKSINWLPPYQEIFGSADALTISQGPEIAGRLNLTGGQVRCLMPPDKDFRRVVFEFVEFVDKKPKKVGNFSRAMSDRVLYEFPLVKNQASITGAPMPGGSAKKPLTIKFKTSKKSAAVPITIMALPIKGGLSPEHFVAFRPLVRSATRSATPQVAGECSYDNGKCVVKDPEPGKYPGDTQHCFVPLIAHP